MSPIDPYEPPKVKSLASKEALEPGIPMPAPAGLRFANLLLDYGVQIGLGFVIGFLAVEVWGEAGYEWLMDIPDIVFGLVIGCAYYLGFEWAFGRTVGKLITGTRVVSASGERVGFGGIVGRTLCRLIPFEAFSFLGAEARGWHDSMTNTYVVKCR